ncbi:GNAT family N-acetyltransferase [Fusibacter sp. Q10-2]|uniref:GNAT family N-acetyltransferase n=1 Tax=Fusibacter ferrireducens TaxID=2785058 RepID=A0ABS0A1J0_9FIRM|nr:GNAT family N-acetyltransferase [Fusibacter ferrireducens]
MLYTFKGLVITVIRKAKISDVENIAKIRVDTWRTAYSGIVNNEFLSSLNYEERANRFRNYLIESSNYMLVYEDEKSKKLFGYIQFGVPNEDDDVDGEIYAIYILQEHQKLGIGRLLMKAAILALKEIGIKKTIVWVFNDNIRARKFYEHLGGTHIKDKLILIGNDELKSCGYLFNL